MIEVPAVVRNKARAAGAGDWLERLPALASSLEADWSITVGHPYEGGTEAFVADATRADGTPAVLKVLRPRDREQPLQRGDRPPPRRRRRMPGALSARPRPGRLAHGAAGPAHV